MSIIQLRGADVRADMAESLREMAARVEAGEVSGLVIVGTGPHLGLPRAHAVTQGDVDHLIGQMERIKLMLITEASERS